MQENKEAMECNAWEPEKTLNAMKRYGMQEIWNNTDKIFTIEKIFKGKKRKREEKKNKKKREKEKEKEERK